MGDPTQFLNKKVIERAAQWQIDIAKNMPDTEKEFQAKMNKLIRNKKDKFLLISLLDRAFRSKNPEKVAESIRKTIEKYGLASFFTEYERMLVRLFLILGHKFPRISVPQVISKIKEQTKNVIIPGEEAELKKYFLKNQKKGIRSNVNFLGEAILGEKEATSRVKEYLDALTRPEVTYVSIKISTIYSQIHPLSYQYSIKVISERLATLFRQAIKFPIQEKDGTTRPKFVNLDMEEYKDLSLTVDVFKNVLGQEEFKNYSAGIVLQAYLPDSYKVLEDISYWALKRVNSNGAPIKVRIVKGANMELEKLESALRKWPLATYSDKIDTDANYKRMVDYALDLQRIQAVHIGIASHNLFEQAYAYEIAKEKNILQYVTIEMLEGMALATANVLMKDNKDMLLYSPVVKSEHFLSAIAYLVRRLDENTAPENFLSKAFNLKPNSEEWKLLSEQYIAAVERKDKLTVNTYRTQDRTNDAPIYRLFDATDNYENEPDTDWVLAKNREWAESIKEKWHINESAKEEEIPVIIDQTVHYEGLQHRYIYDKSRPDVLIAKSALASEQLLTSAIKVAKEDKTGWATMSTRQRAIILANVAQEIRKKRADLIGVATAEVGKMFIETDVEVSEAVDFATFYSHSLLRLQHQTGINYVAKGVGLVVSPWNFPIAIPAGGILAGLAGGNRMILKPSSEAIYCAWEICKCFWDAGVPKSVLQFVPSSGQTVSATLLKEKVDFIIFTGGTDTAMRLYKENPEIALFAETGGKNATIVTAKADRDQAVKDIVHSAFGNSGQKCSATSLLILEEEVYNDQQFKNALLDAAKSLHWGSAWDLGNKMGPIIGPASGDFKVALETLENNENWLLQPEFDNTNPNIISPSIKWGVEKTSLTFKNELFAPLLAVVKAKNLKEAIELANSTGFGLTSGIESLDEHEINYWKEHIEAGNIYVNRSTTGAIVLRQPFGGYKMSSVGKGLKAGGLNYVTQFIDIDKGNKSSEADESPFEKEIIKTLSDQPKLCDAICQAIRSYTYWHKNHFSKATDYFKIPGESNHNRYIPYKKIIIRVTHHNSLEDVLLTIYACKIAKIDFYISLQDNVDCETIRFLKSNEFFAKKNIIITEAAKQLIPHLSYNTRIRYINPQAAEQELISAARANGYYIATDPVHNNGRIELINYYKEQSVSNSYHRYGNLMGREE